MGLFYAYLKYDYNDYYRYLITFLSRETADEWWRTISTPPNPNAGNVRRMSPQFYVLNPRAGLPHVDEFCNKMFFANISTKDGENPTAIPPTEITDHISGGWYFIRSKAEPWSYWYLRISGECLVCGDANCDAVHASSEHRARFCVRARNPLDELRESIGFVLIGEDEIYITARKDHTLYISDTDDLKAAKAYQGETDLVFSDLKNRFVTRAERRVNGEMWEYIESVERGVGEVWELAQ